MVNEKAAKLFIITVSGLLLYFGLKYAAPALLPFLIAYLVAGFTKNVFLTMAVGVILLFAVLSFIRYRQGHK